MSEIKDRMWDEVLQKQFAHTARRPSIVTWLVLAIGVLIWLAPWLARAF